MSRIDELIERLCPDGVEYKTLGEVGTLTRGKRFCHKDAVEDGVPCIHYGEIYTHYGVWADKVKSHVREDMASKLRYAKPGDVVIVGAGEEVEDIGIAVAWLGNEDVAIHDACYTFSNHGMNPKFVSYFFRTSDYHDQIRRYVSSGKISSISAKGVGQARIPVPPMEVQEEIVRVLDSFAELEAELEAQIQAELEARKAQYAYYRKQLIEKADYPRRPLGDICDLQAGKAISAANVASQKTDDMAIRCFGGNGLRGYVRESNVEGNHCLIGRQGALCGNVCFAEGPFYATEHAVVVTPNLEVADSFLFHALTQGDLNQYKTAGAQPGLSVARLKRVEIPLPSLSEQMRIVETLDRFDALVNDISQGLPAEIAARRKQYEHYRDKLLTFKEKTS